MKSGTGSSAPNTAYYLDPPDGGSVTIAEQLRRMGEDAARYRWLRGGPAHYECALAEVERLRDDAERYRWLRGREDGRYMTVYAFRTDIDEVCLGDELDAAIDAAMGLTRPAEE